MKFKFFALFFLAASIFLTTSEFALAQTQCSNGTLPNAFGGCSSIPANSLNGQNNAAPTSSSNSTSSVGAGIECDGEYTQNQDGLCVPKGPGSGSGILNADSVNDLIVRVINILLVLAGAVAVLFVIVGGYFYMTAGGNESQVKKGRQYALNALIGLAIIILSYTIVRLVTSLFS